MSIHKVVKNNCKHKLTNKPETQFCTNNWRLRFSAAFISNLVFPEQKGKLSISTRDKQV